MNADRGLAIGRAMGASASQGAKSKRGNSPSSITAMPGFRLRCGFRWRVRRPAPHQPVPAEGVSPLPQPVGPSGPDADHRGVVEQLGPPSWRVSCPAFDRRDPLAFAEVGRSWYVFRMEPPSRKGRLFGRIMRALKTLAGPLRRQRPQPIPELRRPP
jgi:hypothetical protein